VLYTLPEDARYRIRLVCFREDYLLSTNASAALKTAETSTRFRVGKDKAFQVVEY
jgi:hypothetical protein